MKPWFLVIAMLCPLVAKANELDQVIVDGLVWNQHFFRDVVDPDERLGVYPQSISWVGVDRIYVRMVDPVPEGFDPWDYSVSGLDGEIPPSFFSKYDWDWEGRTIEIWLPYWIESDVLTVYAHGEEVTFNVLTGDVDGDGEVTMLDVDIVYDNVYVWTGRDMRADVNADGWIDYLDVDEVYARLGNVLGEGSSPDPEPDPYDPYAPYDPYFYWW